MKDRSRRFAAIFALSFSLLSAQSRKPVIAIGGISHETNTFNPHETGLREFELGVGAAGVLRGNQIITEMKKANTPVSGFIEGSSRYDFDIYPTIAVGPQTLGIVTDAAFDALTGELVERLKAAPKLDGILLALHGTMVSESHMHADAEVVRRVRAAMGAAIPIVVTHDFHANVSKEIVALTTALVAYKELPHIDAKECGLHAAKIVADTVRGKVHPVQALAKPPMMYNLVFQNTFKAPFKPIVDESKRLEKNPKILAVSVPGGYQWADIPAMGPSVVVVTDNDPALAEREAKRLSDMLWATRDKLKLDLPNPAAAVKIAMNNDRFPVVLLDAGDNIGGGSAGDSTFILEELLRQKAEGWVVALADPEATGIAFQSGVGGAFDMAVGGKTDDLHGKPVRVRGKVKSLHEGKFIEPEVRHGGARYWDMGLSAVIEVEGSTRDLPAILLLMTKRIQPYSIHQLVSVGIYPGQQRILVVKGTVAPRAAYEPVAARLIEVDSGGVSSINPANFKFKNVRPGLFGLSP